VTSRHYGGRCPKFVNRKGHPPAPLRAGSVARRCEFFGFPSYTLVSLVVKLGHYPLARNGQSPIIENKLVAGYCPGYLPRMFWKNSVAWDKNEIIPLEFVFVAPA
jgi:hypothetical protein